MRSKPAPRSPPRKGRGAAASSKGMRVEELSSSYQKDDDINRDYAVFFPGGIAPGGGLKPRLSGVKSWLTLFKQNYAVSACVRLIARAMVSNGWELRATVEEPDERERETVEAFFGNCHDYYTFEEVMIETSETLVLANHAYLEVVHDKAGFPAQLYDLPIDKILPRIDDHGYFYEDAAFVQTVGDNPKDWVRFAWDEVLWLRLPGVRGRGINPMSPIEMLELPLNSSVESERYIHSFFASGGKFGMILENSEWDRGQAEEMRRYYERMYTDASSGHRMMILYDGTTLKEPPRQFWKWGELLDVQKFDGRKVCGVFGVDPRLIGYPGEGNLGGKGEREQVLNELYINNVNPKIEIVSRIITKQIVEQGFGITDWAFRFLPYRTNLDEDSRATLASAYETMTRAGLFNPRRLEDAMVARREFNAELTEPTQEELDEFPGTIGEDRAAQMQLAADRFEAQKAGIIGGDAEQRRAPRTKVERRTPFGEIERRMTTWQDTTTTALLEPLRESLRKAADKLGALYAAGDVQGVKTANLLPGAGPIAVEYRKRLKSYFRECKGDSANELRKLAKDVGVTSKRALEGDSLTEAAAGDIDDFIELFGTTEFDALYGRIVRDERQTFMEGLSAGWTRKEFVAKLQENVWDATEADLSTVVRTSATEFFNLARTQAADESGIVEGYEFSAILDDRTTEVCTALDGTQLAASDSEVDTIRPPLHFNCRSTLNFILLGEGVDEKLAPSASDYDLIHEGFGKRGYDLIRGGRHR